MHALTFMRNDHIVFALHHLLGSTFQSRPQGLELQMSVTDRMLRARAELSYSDWMITE